MIGKRLLMPVLLLILAGCTTRRGESVAVDDTADRWRLEGRLAVSDGRDSGSGSVVWEQDGAYFMISLRAPISGQSWRLSGDDTLATLEGLRATPLTANSPEALLKRELGWHLPVAALRHWLRGRPMRDEITVTRDERGQVTGFVEDGWSIGLREFQTGRPTRITARKPPYQVRLAIKSWVALP